MERKQGGRAFHGSKEAIHAPDGTTGGSSPIEFVRSTIQDDMVHSTPLSDFPSVPKSDDDSRIEVKTRNFSISTVPRDKRGQPILPLNVGNTTVDSLGEVCMRNHFHTERFIFPVGYKVTRYVSNPSI